PDSSGMSGGPVKEPRLAAEQRGGQPTWQDARRLRPLLEAVTLGKGTWADTNSLLPHPMVALE
ncbi:MAG: hypothetical protein ACK523_12525, partial [Pirellulaceae bacterium]